MCRATYTESLCLQNQNLCPFLIIYLWNTFCSDRRRIIWMCALPLLTMSSFPSQLPKRPSGWRRRRRPVSWGSSSWRIGAGSSRSSGSRQRNDGQRWKRGRNWNWKKTKYVGARGKVTLYYCRFKKTSGIRDLLKDPHAKQVLDCRIQLKDTLCETTTSTFKSTGSYFSVCFPGTLWGSDTQIHEEDMGGNPTAKMVMGWCTKPEQPERRWVQWFLPAYMAIQSFSFLQQICTCSRRSYKMLRFEKLKPASVCFVNYCSVPPCLCELGLR